MTRSPPLGLHKRTLNSLCLLILLIHTKHKNNKMKSCTDLMSSFPLSRFIHWVDKTKNMWLINSWAVSHKNWMVRCFPGDSWFYPKQYARPFDQNLASHRFISFTCTRPFYKNVWSSFIDSFFSARQFDRKLGSLLIYLIYLYMTIWPKYRILVNLIFLLWKTIRPQIRVLINLLFSFAYDHSTRFRGHFYSLIYSFDNSANISFTLFLALLSLHLIHCIQGSTSYRHILYTIFMEMLLLYVFTLNPWLNEVLAITQRMTINCHNKPSSYLFCREVYFLKHFQNNWG